MVMRGNRTIRTHAGNLKGERMIIKDMIAEIEEINEDLCDLTDKVRETYPSAEDLNMLDALEEAIDELGWSAEELEGALEEFREKIEGLEGDS
jgi:predicted  nucleic acid-binding Zn-ribbon protein